MNDKLAIILDMKTFDAASALIKLLVSAGFNAKHGQDPAFVHIVL